MKKIKCPVCGYESPIGTEKCPVCKVNLAKVADNRTVINDAEVQSWSVLLLDAGASKLSVIKVIRQITGLGLKEAKDLIDNPPQVVISGIPEMTALQLEQELIATGANVIITRTTEEERKQKLVEDERLKHENSIAERGTANMGYGGNHIEFNEVEEQNNKLGDKRQQIEKGQTSGCLVFFLSFLAVAYIASSLGLDASSGWVALLIIVVAIIVFVCVLVSRENKTNDKLEQYREEIKVEQHQKRDVMSEVFIRANLEGFIPSTVIYDPSNRFCISVDKSAKRFLVKNTSGARYTIYRFSDLIDFELSQDGISILSGNEREALMGGILFGTTGAVIGASTSREVQEYCSSLYVALTVNNIESFRVKIPLITERTSKSSRKYNFALERAKEMIALLQLIKNDPEKDNSVLPTGCTVPQISSEAVEIIKEYKELMDLGLITREEYERMRKELSNI